MSKGERELIRGKERKRETGERHIYRNREKQRKRLLERCM